MQYETPECNMAGKHLLACQWVLFVYVGRAAAAPSTAAAASACVLQLQLCGAHRVIGRCTVSRRHKLGGSCKTTVPCAVLLHFVLCGMLAAVETAARAALDEQLS